MQSLLKRATAGDADAQCELGKAHVHGNGVVKDHKKAVEWLSKAAAQKHADASTMMGYAFANSLYD